MSARTLQRVVVRMLHDAAFRAAVYADPATALADLALTPDDHRLLLAADARAWGADTQRSERVLSALVTELPVAVLVLLEEGLSLARLRRFFEGAQFHATIMARGSLAPAFGDYLATLTKRPRTQAFIRLEHAIALLRRACPLTVPKDHLVRSSHVRPVALAGGTLAAWSHAKQALGSDPTARLLAKSRPRVAAVDPRTTEWVLLQRNAATPDEPEAAFVGEALGRLLEAAEQPTTRDVLIAVAEREGAETNEASEILDELIAEGLLASCQGP